MVTLLGLGSEKLVGLSGWGLGCLGEKDRVRLQMFLDADAPMLMPGVKVP